jgi:soluble lytic murein transglycosylase
MSEKALDRAASDPAAYLARDRGSPEARAHREVAIYALERLARKAADEAARDLEKMAAKMPSEDARYAWGRIAFQAALSHDPQALAWYANAGDAVLTDTQLAWKARAAMRAGDWKSLLAAIQSLSPEEAREGTWRYWRARALRGLGEKEASEQLLRGLAKESGFYALLAADEVGALAAPDWKGWQPEAADLDRARAIPGIARALILYRLGLDNEALREWLWAIKPLGDRELLAAAEVARQAGIPDRAINTANRTVVIHDYAQRYPTPHRDALTAAARQWNLDEALVYGIIRQESRFMPQARSRVGALGLMQLMPSTARWVARQMPVQPFNVSMLVQPEVNVQMGSYYFKRVQEDLGHSLLATAAYNAGPGRARRWRDERPIEGAIYAETIPFNETRDYVKQVMTNAWFYSHRLNGKVASLKQILGTVPGRGGEPPEAAAVAATLP